MLTALLLCTLAAPGDAIYIMEADAPIVLSQPEKLELASALASTFPNVIPATMDRYVCFANPPAVKDRTAVDLQALAASLPFPCHAIDGNPTTTAEAAPDYELETDGACKLKDRPNGKSFLLCESKSMNGDAKILNGAFTQSVFGKNLPLIWDFRCGRSNSEDPGEVSCIYRYIKIADPDTWRADGRVTDTKVRGLFGKVTP